MRVWKSEHERRQQRRGRLTARAQVEFANKPILFHQLDALRAIGVSEVVLAVSYRAEALVAAMDAHYADDAFKVTISVEDEPLGTGGPLGLARDKLLANADGSETECVFVLNSDVACEFPFEKLLNFHRAHGGEGTIMTTPVDEPSKYGVVLSNADGLIERFVEKPKEYVGNMINAGLYLLSPAFLKRIEPVPTSIERDVFPVVAAQRQLYALELGGFWMDVGQPKDYLRGNGLYLKSLGSAAPEKLASAKTHPGVKIRGRVLIDKTAVIGSGCDIGPDVVIGAGCVVGSGVRLADCTLLNKVRVADHALVRHSIIGWESSIGAWAQLVDLCVLGADVSVAAEIRMEHVTVCPNKGVKADVPPGTIVL